MRTEKQGQREAGTEDRKGDGNRKADRGKKVRAHKGTERELG